MIGNIVNMSNGNGSSGGGSIIKGYYEIPIMSGGNINTFDIGIQINKAIIWYNCYNFGGMYYGKAILFYNILEENKTHIWKGAQYSSSSIEHNIINNENLEDFYIDVKSFSISGSVITVKQRSGYGDTNKSYFSYSIIS